MKQKPILLVILISVTLLCSSFVAVTFAQMPTGDGNQACEQCGMTVDATSQAHFRVVDVNGTSHYVECMMCALKLLVKYDTLNITTTCDWYGPNTVITVNAKQHGVVATISPPNALVIAGGGCSKNRIVSNQAAASALLANNGTSNYLAAIQKYVDGIGGAIVTVPINSTIMTVAQAALQFGGTTPSPSPSPSSPAAQSCEQCGMGCPADLQAHFKIVDGSGITHYACCIKCALKLLTKVDALNITTNCDWYGPIFPITISVKDNLSSITVNPSTAMIIDGSCANNRVVYDQTAANALLANGGKSKYLCSSQNTTIPSNSTTIAVAQAVTTLGARPSPSPSPTPIASPSASPSPTMSPTLSPSTTTTPAASTPSSSNPTISPAPTPSATPTPTNTPTPTITPIPSAVVNQDCEVCTMQVNAAAQARYQITDGNGNIHYAECFMCALNLANDYESLHIVTCCDWNGPNYTITINTSQYGKVVTVSPITAMFLNGGSCVINRAAYNQAAADALLANGYSQYTLPMQQYALPTTTTVTTVKDYIAKIAQTNNTETQQGLPTTEVLALAAVVGVIVIVGSVVAFKKLRK